MSNLKTSELLEETTIGPDDFSCISKDTGGGTFSSKKVKGRVILRHSTQREISTPTPTAILISDGFLLFDSTSNTISIDLPAATVGKIQIPFKDAGVNSVANNITFNRVGADTIVDTAAGQTSTVIASNGYSGSFISNGVDTWYLT